LGKGIAEMILTQSKFPEFIMKYCTSAGTRSPTFGEVLVNNMTMKIIPPTPLWRYFGIVLSARSLYPFNNLKEKRRIIP
jgi:hypothetical protein